MSILFVGWNHRGAPLDLRERLAFTPERAAEALEALRSHRLLAEGAIVSTCNRAELYGVAEAGVGLDALTEFLSGFHRVDAETLRRTAHSGSDETSVRHLFRVASGLDSMVLGEAQILGQVREAHRRAIDAGSSRAVTNRLFMSALECGKRVRAETALGTRPTSVPGLALSLARRVFDQLAGRRVLLLGAGETVELTARLLVEDGVTDLVFANRSPGKAEALAADAGGRTVPWDGRHAAFAEADVVLTATSAPEPVIAAAPLRAALHAARRRGPLLVLDLAVPRDVDPAVDDVPDLYRYDLDSLTALAERNAAERRAEVPKAEAIVERHATRFLAWYGTLADVDVLRALRGKLEAMRQAEIARAASKLERLGPDGREAVERITESLVNKILHAPTVGLKEGDAAERLEKASAVRSLFRLDDGDGG